MIVGFVYALFYSCLVSIILASKVNSSMRSNVVCLFYVVMFCYRILFADQRDISVVQYGESCHSERSCFVGLCLLWRARFLVFSRRNVVVSLLPSFIMLRSSSAMVSPFRWVGFNVAWSSLCCCASCDKRGKLSRRGVIVTLLPYFVVFGPRFAVVCIMSCDQLYFSRVVTDE